MKYLSKTTESEILKQGWLYSKQSERTKIREALLEEQSNFCAYSERYIAPIDACDIEHFDDRLKGKDEDNYWNWYAVHHWFNMRKRRLDDRFLPIMRPYDERLHQRIKYENGAFHAVDEEDIEAANLIKFLGWNNPTIAAYRAKTIARIVDLRALFQDDATFVEYLTSEPENLSFITVLEAELGLSLDLE